MARETRVQFLVKSYQKIEFETSLLGFMRYVSKVKLSNPEKRVAHSSTAWCSSYGKRSLQISLTLSRHFSLSFIASGRSSGLLPVSSHSSCMYVWAGRDAFAWPYAGVHRSTSLMSSSLCLQQSPACLVRLAWIVFVMGGWWPYCWCLVGCCRQDLFNIARNILV